MPAILDRCVMHVMAKGHDKSSAFAICRSSLDLKEDGTDDMKEMEMSDTELEAKISAGYPMNPESTQKIIPAVAAYGGPPAEPKGLPKAATDAPGSGTDTGRTHMPSVAHNPKPGSDVPRFASGRPFQAYQCGNDDARSISLPRTTCSLAETRRSSAILRILRLVETPVRPSARKTSLPPPRSRKLIPIKR